LSVVVPCYNESATLAACVDRLRAIATSGLRLEIVIVNDASTDDSLEQARELEMRYPEIKVITHSLNQGKGAALRSGFESVTGDFVAVQDADLEYDPRDLVRLLEPLQAGDADVVFGSRYLSGGTHRVLEFWHSLGNRFLTLMSNLMTDLHLTDMETCYKVFKRDVIQSIEIEEDRFGFEPEVVAKIARLQLRLYEMGISYEGRGYAEGKKIGARDGLRALYCILKYNAQKPALPAELLVCLAMGVGMWLVDVVGFEVLQRIGFSSALSIPVAFAATVLANNRFATQIRFYPSARPRGRALRYRLVLLFFGAMDVIVTWGLSAGTTSVSSAKALVALLFPVLCFCSRRVLSDRPPPEGRA
jgi:glycosyltransferase involved in cell wall biosynthesis